MADSVQKLIRLKPILTKAGTSISMKIQLARNAAPQPAAFPPGRDSGPGRDGPGRYVPGRAGPVSRPRRVRGGAADDAAEIRGRGGNWGGGGWGRMLIRTRTGRVSSSAAVPAPRLARAAGIPWRAAEEGNGGAPGGR